MNVHTRKVGETPWVTLSGELDISTAPEVERELVRIDREAPSRIVVDLRELTFIDSTGLRAIITADARFRRSGARMILVPGPPAVDRVFRIALLDQRLEFSEDPESIEEDHVDQG
jgi:anti-sigma B factor antagonist